MSDDNEYYIPVQNENPCLSDLVNKVREVLKLNIRLESIFQNYNNDYNATMKERTSVLTLQAMNENYKPIFTSITPSGMIKSPLFSSVNSKKDPNNQLRTPFKLQKSSFGRERKRLSFDDSEKENIDQLQASLQTCHSNNLLLVTNYEKKNKSRIRFTANEGELSRNIDIKAPIFNHGKETEYYDSPNLFTQERFNFERKPETITSLSIYDAKNSLTTPPDQHRSIAVIVEQNNSPLLSNKISEKRDKREEIGQSLLISDKEAKYSDNPDIFAQNMLCLAEKSKTTASFAIHDNDEHCRLSTKYFDKHQKEIPRCEEYTTPVKNSPLDIRKAKHIEISPSLFLSDEETKIYNETNTKEQDSSCSGLMLTENAPRLSIEQKNVSKSPETSSGMSVEHQMALSVTLKTPNKYKTFPNVDKGERPFTSPIEEEKGILKRNSGQEDVLNPITDIKTPDNSKANKRKSIDFSEKTLINTYLIGKDQNHGCPPKIPKLDDPLIMAEKNTIDPSVMNDKTVLPTDNDSTMDPVSSASNSKISWNPVNFVTNDKISFNSDNDYTMNDKVSFSHVDDSTMNEKISDNSVNFTTDNKLSSNPVNFVANDKMSADPVNCATNDKISTHPVNCATNDKMSTDPVNFATNGKISCNSDEDYTMDDQVSYSHADVSTMDENITSNPVNSTTNNQISSNSVNFAKNDKISFNPGNDSTMDNEVSFSQVSSAINEKISSNPLHFTKNDKVSSNPVNVVANYKAIFNPDHNSTLNDETSFNHVDDSTAAEKISTNSVNCVINHSISFKHVDYAMDGKIPYSPISSIANDKIPYSPSDTIRDFTVNDEISFSSVNDYSTNHNEFFKSSGDKFNTDFSTTKSSNTAEKQKEQKTYETQTCLSPKNVQKTTIEDNLDISKSRKDKIRINNTVVHEATDVESLTNRMKNLSPSLKRSIDGNTKTNREVSDNVSHVKQLCGQDNLLKTGPPKVSSPKISAAFAMKVLKFCDTFIQANTRLYNYRRSFFKEVCDLRFVCAYIKTITAIREIIRFKVNKAEPVETESESDIRFKEKASKLLWKATSWKTEAENNILVGSGCSKRFTNMKQEIEGMIKDRAQDITQEDLLKWETSMRVTNKKIDDMILLRDIKRPSLLEFGHELETLIQYFIQCLLKKGILKRSSEIRSD